MKMASLVVLIPVRACRHRHRRSPVLAPAGLAGMSNPGIHGFSEVLYALSSASNNNGSAFGGLSANTPFYNTLLGICMFFARFPLAIGMLAIAGSLAAKKHVPISAGTLADAHAAVRRAAGQHGHRDRRADVPAGARARADCRTTRCYRSLKSEKPEPRRTRRKTENRLCEQNEVFSHFEKLFLHFLHFLRVHISRF
jgi:hypothetical protein